MPQLPIEQTSKVLNRRTSIESSGRGSTRSRSSSNFSTKSNFNTQNIRQKSETRLKKNKNYLKETNYDKKDDNEWRQLHSNYFSSNKHDKNLIENKIFSRYLDKINY